MSFNRRPNRIAGPGFNINVRYDDQHMYKARSSANGANSKVNSANSVENFDVKEAELLVAMNKGTMYHDGMTHCFSTANGFPASEGYQGGDSEDAVVRDILSQVRFIGVALTEYQPSKAYSEQGFVAQVGGVVTLINEGTDIIKPGDKVELGLNLSKRRKQTREKGIPRSKIRFCIQKAVSTDEKIKNAIDAHETSNANAGVSTVDKQAATNAVQAAEAAFVAQKQVFDTAEAAAAVSTLTTAQKKAADKKVKEEKKKLVPLEKALKKAEKALADCSACKFKTDDLREFLKIYEKSQSHVIGKAYSYARPGDRLEVGLQPRHPY